MSDHWATLADHLEANRGAHQEGCWSSVTDRAAFYRLLSEQQKEQERHRKTHLHRSWPFNSTKFTDCCGLAVHSEKICPGCGCGIFR